MKVKVDVVRHESIEVEIPDEFRKLAVPHPWEDPNVTEDDYSKCVDAVKFVTGIPLASDNEELDTYFIAVHSAENDEIMLEY